MRKRNIAIVLTVRSKSKREAFKKVISLMNKATCDLDVHDEFPEWGFHNEYKLCGEKVIKK